MIYEGPLFWTILIILASLSGLFFSVKYLRKWTDRMMPYLISLSAGVFLVTALQLINEGFHLQKGGLTIGGAIGGFIIILIIQKLLPESHHHHDSVTEEVHSKQSAIKILIADSVHNIVDGIVIAIAFAVNKEIGIFTAISILIHEFIQEISEYFVYIDSGYSIKKAITLNILSASTLIIGVLMGSIIGDNDTVQAILLGLASGMFLQVVFADLIPNPHQMEKDQVIRHVGAFILGVLIIISLGLIVPHEHDHPLEEEDYLKGVDRNIPNIPLRNESFMNDDISPLSI